MAQTTLGYLEQRFLVLEKQIANALRHGPTHDLAIADLRCRQLIIAEEIDQQRRLVQRSGLLAG
jgi:hypothetical protein